MTSCALLTTFTGGHALQTPDLHLGGPSGASGEVCAPERARAIPCAALYLHERFLVLSWRLTPIAAHVEGTCWHGAGWRSLARSDTLIP
jgi:hypothetical protein